MKNAGHKKPAVAGLTSAQREGTNTRTKLAAYLFVALASAAPLVTAYQQPPQPVFFNQWLAALLWFLAWFALLPFVRVRVDQLKRPAVLALGAFTMILLVAITVDAAMGRTPWFLAWPALLVLFIALAFVVVCAQLPEDIANGVFYALMLGLLVGALVNGAVATLQTFAPLWHDDVWIAARPGDRVFGNLRQPNLLALVVVWGALATFACFGKQRAMAALLTVFFAICLYWSGSRAGLLAAVVASFAIAMHLGVATSISKKNKIIASIVIALSLVAAIAVAFAMIVYGDQRAISTAQRVLLWRNVLELIAHEPWIGVGFNQLNFAWTLTPFSTRAPDVFDHA
ncbi:MAG: O-antigen ligase family protein, partial [Casimicrobium sp.]